MSTSPARITRLLGEWRNGDPDALAELLPLVYADLRRHARRLLGQEHRAQSIAASDLVHDAFLRLTRTQAVQWQGREQFFAAVAGTMRRILVEHARRRQSVKRGNNAPHVPLKDDLIINDEACETILAVHEALTALSALFPRRARVVELRYFAGMTEEEIARAIDVSVETVRRDWRAAKAWLFKIMQDQRDQ